MSTAVWLINSYDAKRNVLACLSYYGSPELCLPPLIEHFLGLRLVPPDTPWAHDFKSLFSWCWQREFLIMIVIKGNCVLAGKHCQLAKFGYGSLSLSLSSLSLISLSSRYPLSLSLLSLSLSLSLSLLSLSLSSALFSLSPSLSLSPLSLSPAYGISAPPWPSGTQ